MSRTATILLATMLIGLPASAAHVTVPGTPVSMDIPAGIMPMPKSVAELHDSVECRMGRRKAISQHVLDCPPPVCQSQCHYWRPVQPFARHQVTLHQ